MHDPYDLAEKLLSLVVSSFEDVGIDLPETRYVAPGSNVAYDGPQVTTNVIRLFYGQPGAELADAAPAGLPVVVSVELQVAILRDTPTQDDEGNAPSVAALQDSASENLKDLQQLRQTLRDISTSYALVERGSPVSLAPVTTYGPEGALVGVVGALSVVIS